MTTLFWTTSFAFVLCAALTPLVRRLALRWGVVDTPDGVRKLHSKPIPLGGGLAIVISLFLTLAGLAYIPSPWQASLWKQSSYLAGILLSVTIISAVGLLDDRVSLRGRQKLIGQVAAIGVLISFGLVIRKFTIFEWEVDLGIMAIPFTAFWLLGAVNALNLIDGVDGLATSIGIVFSLAMAAMAYATGHEFDAILAMALAGSLFGFLIYNFPPARIFLGDSGSMVIGLMLGALAIRSSLKGPATVALAAPTAVWAVLIFDVSMAIVRRKLTGRSLYTTDRGHLHHTLLRKGLSGTRIVVWVGMLCAFCGAGALASICYQNDLLAIGSALAVVGALVLTRFFGDSEVMLIANSVKSFLGSLLKMPHLQDSASAPICSRLQGDREWNLLWEGITEFAKEHDLCMVQLNVNLPAINEEYHAVWKRKAGTKQEQMWHATLPLMAGGAPIGRLRLAGLADEARSMSDWLAELIADLKPFEDHVVELAEKDDRPHVVMELRSPHRRSAETAASPN